MAGTAVSAICKYQVALPKDSAETRDGVVALVGREAMCFQWGKEERTVSAAARDHEGQTRVSRNPGTGSVLAVLFPH